MQKRELTCQRFSITDREFALQLRRSGIEFDERLVIRVERSNTASSLRFDANIVKAHEEMPQIDQGITWGPLGQAAAGSSIVWYGIHTFEMLEKIMGLGAIAVTAVLTE